MTRLKISFVSMWSVRQCRVNGDKHLDILISWIWWISWITVFLLGPSSFPQITRNKKERIKLAKLFPFSAFPFSQDHHDSFALNERFTVLICTDRLECYDSPVLADFGNSSRRRYSVVKVNRRGKFHRL